MLNTWGFNWMNYISFKCDLHILCNAVVVFSLVVELTHHATSEGIDADSFAYRNFWILTTGNARFYHKRLNSIWISIYIWFFRCGYEYNILNRYESTNIQKTKNYRSKFPCTMQIAEWWTLKNWLRIFVRIDLRVCMLRSNRLFREFVSFTIYFEVWQITISIPMSKKCFFGKMFDCI